MNKKNNYMYYLNLFFIFLFGASIGSFLNVVIDRLIQEESLSGRSHCDYCHHKLAWYDLIPIISFFLIKGRCRYCHKKISWQYPIIEALTGTVFILIAISNIKYQISNIFHLFFLFGIASCFIVIFVSDLKYHLVSDWVLLSLFIFVLGFHLINFNHFQPFLTNFIPSSFFVALPIFLIYFISKERAMGFGDVIMSAIVGFLLGWQKGLLALYIAVITGAIYGIVLIIFRQKKLKSKIAFGPFIIIGVVLMLIWGDKVVEIVKRMYGL